MGWGRERLVSNGYEIIGRSGLGCIKAILAIESLRAYFAVFFEVYKIDSFAPLQYQDLWLFFVYVRIISR